MAEIRVSVRLGTFDLHYEGSQAFFERVVDPLIAQVAPYPARKVAPGVVSASMVRAPQVASVAAEAASGPGHSPEFRAFVKRLGPEASAPDRQVLAVAFYLCNYEKRDEIRAEDVAACFHAIGLEPPEGLAGLMEDLSQRLRFMAAGQQEGSWAISTKGVNYVKTRLLGQAQA
ncbi:MAG: hypothetical protein ACKOSS_09240 [Planctomycetia bacterium]